MLNQILEFHGIIQAQMARVSSLRELLFKQQTAFRADAENDVVKYLRVVQTTLQVRRIRLCATETLDSSSLMHRTCEQRLSEICHELRNATNVLRLPSRRRFPFCSHVDHVRSEV